MKKIALTIALVIITLTGNAQITKNNLLEGYKVGDVLEKSTYTAPDAAIQENIWCGGYTASKKAEGTTSPIIGAELNYPGYNEKGPSITLGFEKGIKGTRSTVYAMTTSGKVYRKGTYYLAFLANFPTLGNKSPYEIVALNASHVGGSSRGELLVNRTEDGKLKFTLGFSKAQIEAAPIYDFKKTYLIILKVNYDTNSVALFINPSLEGAEPQPTVEMPGISGAFKAGIKAISIRNNHSFKGNIGNFRLASSWEDIAAH